MRRFLALLCMVVALAAAAAPSSATAAGAKVVHPMKHCAVC